MANHVQERRCGRVIKKRETEMDILRLLALLGVIFTHASGAVTGSAVTGNIMTFLTAAVTWHVPVFVMISGRFFLDPDRQMPALKIRKATGRLISAFAFWNVIYQGYYILTGAYTGLNGNGILSQAMIGPYHFWYLFMLLCLYAIVPFLRRIVREKKLMEYFIVLFLIFECLNTYGPDLPLVGATVSRLVTMTDFHFALGYSGYYILGYYLKRYPLSGKKEIGLYVLGALMLLFTGCATVWKAAQGAPGKEWFSKYLMPNVAVEAAAVYTFFVNRVSRMRFGERFTKIVSGLAACSFGTYLVHALVLAAFPLPGLRINPILFVLLSVLWTYLISTAIAALVRRIPYIGKRIT